MMFFRRGPQEKSNLGWFVERGPVTGQSDGLRHKIVERFDHGPERPRGALLPQDDAEREHVRLVHPPRGRLSHGRCEEAGQAHPELAVQDRREGQGGRGREEGEGVRGRFGGGENPRGELLLDRHEERGFRRPLVVGRGAQQGGDPVQGQRGRHVEHLLQANRARILHHQSEIRRPPRGGFPVHRQGDGGGQQPPEGEDPKAEGGCADHGSGKPVQAHLQDARHHVLRPRRHGHLAGRRDRGRGDQGGGGRPVRGRLRAQGARGAHRLGSIQGDAHTWVAVPIHRRPFEGWGSAQGARGRPWVGKGRAGRTVRVQYMDEGGRRWYSGRVRRGTQQSSDRLQGSKRRQLLR